MSLADHLGGKAFARVFERARQRLEREPHSLDHATTQLRNPTATEREAMEGLLGRGFAGRSISVSLKELDEALIAGTGRGLVPWLTHLHGPLRDRPAMEAARQAAIREALQRVQKSPLAERDWFQVWIEELQTGPMTRLVGSDALDRLHSAVRVLEALPAADVPIALFASDHAGGTKALGGTPLERLCLRALALRAGQPRPENAEARRALWQAFGVVPDDLAAHVLVLNMPAVGAGVVDRMLQLAAAEGLPVRLTLHQLVHHPPTIADDPVYVCENPAILRMAAERLRNDSAPLIATEGRANTAFWRLVTALPGTVSVRGDFDKEGLEIAGAVIGRLRATPWRFDRETYESARRPDNKKLPPRLPPTPWSPDLAEAMAGGVRVEEEELLDLLMVDLKRKPRRSRPSSSASPDDMSDEIIP